jgi:hypothetical protein
MCEQQADDAQRDSYHDIDSTRIPEKGERRKGGKSKAAAAFDFPPFRLKLSPIAT